MEKPLNEKPKSLFAHISYIVFNLAKNKPQGYNKFITFITIIMSAFDTINVDLSRNYNLTNLMGIELLLNLGEGLKNKNDSIVSIHNHS